MKHPIHFDFQRDATSGVATITLNRPDRLNALTFDSYDELRRTFREISLAEGVRVVIITGTGKAFCSGGDVHDIIGPLTNRDYQGLLEFTRMTCDLVLSIRRCRRPVIAALNGTVAGAGAVIAAACDIRVAAESAKIAFLFTKVGLAGADMGAAYLLPRIVGTARATELLFLGDKVTAEDALRIGLVNRIVPPESLITEARALAGRLAAGPTFALGMTKTLLNQELDADFAAAIEAEAEGQAICMQTPDFRRAYEAFKARRQ
jgi:enoyl-CoA hydratase/carnithine racemase